MFFGRIFCSSIRGITEPKKKNCRHKERPEDKKIQKLQKTRKYHNQITLYLDGSI